LSLVYAGPLAGLCLETANIPAVTQINRLGKLFPRNPRLTQS
jgi:hypothetical protein